MAAAGYDLDQQPTGFNDHRSQMGFDVDTLLATFADPSDQDLFAMLPGSHKIFGLIPLSVVPDFKNLNISPHLSPSLVRSGGDLQSLRELLVEGVHDLNRLVLLRTPDRQGFPSNREPHRQGLTCGQTDSRIEA